MDKKQWLRGIAVSLSVTGFSGISYGQNYVPAPNSGLAPSSFPMPTTPLYRGNLPPQQMIIGGSNPYLLAQNEGHVHVPHGNYTAAENVQNALPPNVGSPMTQGVPQSYTAPLPPVYNPPVQNQPIYSQSPVHSSFVQPNSSATPMYQVPAQYNNVPQPTPAPQVQYMGDPNASVGSTSSCQQCNQPSGQLWNGYSTSSCAPTYAPAYVPSYAPQAVTVNPWIVGGGGLILNRDDNDYIRLSHDTANTGAASLSTFDGRMRTSGGFEVFGGRYFGCGKYALIGSYWGLFPGDQSRTIFDPESDTTVGNSIRTNLPFTVLGPGGAPTSLHGIEMPPAVANNVAGPNGGQNVYDWYDNAFAHRLVRSQSFNNVEINLFSFGLGGAVRHGVAGYGSGIAQGYQPGWTNGRIGRGGFGMGGISGGGYGSCGSCGSSGACGCSSCSTASCNTCAVPSCSGPTGVCAPITGAQCSRLRFAMLGGIRWLRFNDRMEYATSENDGDFSGADDFFYRNTVRNDLLGIQLGGRATYCTGRRVNFYGGTKFGVFGNRINYDTYAGTTSTAAIVSSFDSYDNQAYDIHAATTGLSLLGEGELGTGIQVSRGWTANCGYRVIGATGIATAPGQIPYDFSLLNDVRRIHHHDSLVLHGVSFGGMYNW